MTTQSAIGKIKASRVNNLDAAEYVGPAGQIWYDVNTGVLRLGDNSTPGGTIIGGGGGGGSPGTPNHSIQFNNGGVFAGDANLLYNNSTATLSLTGVVAATTLSATGYVYGNGAFLTGITGTGSYDNTNVAAYLSSGTVSTVIQTTANISGSYIFGNGAYLTGISGGGGNYANSNVASYLASGTVTTPITTTANVTAQNFIGNGSQLTGLPPSLVYITSNITSIVAGQSLNVEAVYGNAQYPGGVFTIYQAPQPRPTITVNNFWTSTTSASKNAYSNYAGNVVNSSSVTLNLGISTPATFSVQSTDNIIIGNTVITGSNLTGLGITGTGGTYVISSGLVGTDPETAPVSNVQVNLTTSAGGPFPANGTPLTTVQPVPFSLSGITASFANTTITPGLGNSQPVHYSVTVGAGTQLTGNIIISGAANLTTSVGNVLVGNTANINSTAGNFVVTATYTGAGLYGAGNTTSTANVSLTRVNETTPLFYKSTPDGSNPNFLPTDPNYSNNWVPAPGTPGNTYGILTNEFNPQTEFYWLAIPDSDFWSYGPITSGNPPNLYYNYALTGIGVVNSSFAAAYGNGTDTFGGSGGTLNIGDIPYVALGFTGFANVDSPSNPANVFIWVSTSPTS